MRALGPLPEEDSGFGQAEICSERVFLGVPRVHRLAGRERVDPSELHGETLLTLGRGHKLVDNVRALAQISGRGWWRITRHEP